jgi:hypothetical protein
MPIDYSKYPDDWREISLRIRERAGNRCEGSPAYPDCREKNGDFGYRENGTGLFVSMVDRHLMFRPLGARMFRIVLTVAHLNHDPMDCRDENLRAWCQRCHLVYDAKQHAQHARETRRSRKAVADLFAPPK